MFPTANRIPFIITILLTVVGLASTIFLCQQGANLGMGMADIVSNSIQIWICVGAFVSVAYVISSYLHTNTAFILSQKPHLLFFVSQQENQRSEDNAEMVHKTVINYQNKSGNPFYDLSLLIKLSTPNTIVDLGDLFTKNMYMAGHDCRERWFITVDELRKRGFDLNSAVEQNQQIILSLTYIFKFNKKTEKVTVQEYFWDTSDIKPRWTIK